jgi:glycosidase
MIEYLYIATKRVLSYLALSAVIFTSLANAQSHEDWSHNLSIYEVNIRQYTQAGTFIAFEPHLDRLKEMGVGILWLMPINPIGQKNRLGSLGSYYSVKNYLEVNPEFGTTDNFKSLVQKIHDKGMYVIIDWVANHTSWDNNLTTEHPEWYSKDQNGNFTAPPGTNWTDVIELDYSKQGLRDYMIDAMKFWVIETGIDGFRCDAVSMVPEDFWNEAISELRTIRSDLFFLAEGDGKQWHTNGFDMTYGWGLYGFGEGVFINAINFAYPASYINTYFNSELSNYSNAYRMYFTSNHDENSWYGTTNELFGNAADVFAVATATINGMPLIYSGQEAGLNKRLQFFEKDPISWGSYSKAPFYKTLLDLKKENKALWNGANGGLQQRIPTNKNFYVYAFTREKDDDKIFAVLNVTNQLQTAVFKDTGYEGSYKEIFTGDTITFAQGDSVTIPAYSYFVYEKINKSSDVKDEAAPASFRLEQNYPNPFNPSTKIRFTLANTSKIKLTVCDILGKEIRTLVDGKMTAGIHEITFDAGNIAAGVYIYSLRTPYSILSNKMILLK